MKSTFLPQFLQFEEAVSEITDHATIGLVAFGWSGLAQGFCRALADGFQRTGHPRALTLIHGAGHTEGVGIDLLAAQKGLAARIVGGHWGLTPAVRYGGENDWYELHNWPQGAIIHSYRAMASGRPGIRTPIGLETYIDPRQTGGCLNQTAKNHGSFLRLTTDEMGMDCIFYPALKLDYVFIRGSSADKCGNISTHNEPLAFELTTIALAARKNGGKVFCQVESLDDRIYTPDEIHLPGFLVDVIAVTKSAEQDHRHCLSTTYNSAFLGKDANAPIENSAQPDQGMRSWIGRRAAQEIRAGDTFNLGIGLPGDSVPHAVLELHLRDKTVATLESGIIGGTGVGGKDFGITKNPQSKITDAAMFDLYHGGGLDIAIMGMAETDRFGNINVSQFSGRNVGCGGFIDITQSAKKIVFTSLFCGKHSRYDQKNQKLSVTQNGDQKKFVETIELLSFNAKRALTNAQEVVLVTERAVFTLTWEGWRLDEIAPGLTLENDIFPHMAFRPLVSESIKHMPWFCFEDEY